ncbi:MAG: response regulator [Pseudomonadota bacterium]
MKRILVVDDEPAITRLIKLNLEATGKFEVHAENRGAQALERARACQPDLILLDIMMPDLLGSDVAAQLQADPELHDVKIVFLTAMLKKNEMPDSKGEIGGQHIVAKPVSTEDLITVIETVIG